MLIQAWDNAAYLIESDQSQKDSILHWVLRYTLHLMLVGQWLQLPTEKRDHIKKQIENAIPKIQKSYNSVLRCKYILANIDNPWGDKNLLMVLKGDPQELTEHGKYFYLFK